MNHEEVFKKKIEDAAWNNDWIQILESVRRDPTISGHNLDIRINAFLGEIAGNWNWQIRILVESKGIRFHDKHCLDHENWQSDVHLVCKALFFNILRRGLFEISYMEDKKNWEEVIKKLSSFKNQHIVRD